MTDSAAALPPAVAAAHAVTVVPMWMDLDGRSVPDGAVATAAILAAERVTTSGPTPGEFAEAITRALAAADAAIVLTVTAAVSGTNSSARVGAAGFGPCVQVLDTGSAAGGEALVVLAAAVAAGRPGASLASVAGRAQTVAARVRVVGALASADHLARSGRVPDLAARAVHRLGVRPMFELRNGRVRPLRPTRHGDLDRMARLCIGDRPAPGGALRAVVMHAEAPDRAEGLEQRLREAAPADVVVGPFGPAMVTHTGAGLVGVAWWWEVDGDQNRTG